MPGKELRNATSTQAGGIRPTATLMPVNQSHGVVGSALITSPSHEAQSNTTSPLPQAGPSRLLWQLQLPILVRGHILGFREIVLLNGVYPLLERGNIVRPQITDEVSFKVGARLSGCVIFLVNSWVQRAQPYSRMKNNNTL